MSIEFTISDLRHEFAVWTAGTAYKRLLKDTTIPNARLLLEHAKLDEIRSPADLPELAALDEWLIQIMNTVLAKAIEIMPEFKFGRAQKLVNVYLKTKLVLVWPEDPKVAALHPPIDANLLSAIARQDNKPVEFDDLHSAAPSWQVFTESQYRDYIRIFKIHCGDEPLWMMEKYWKPERSQG